MSKLTIKGFTLIEILVVVLIIGILAAIALPQYKRIILHARFTQTIVSLNALIKAQEMYYMTHNTYVTNLNNLDTEVAEGCGVNGKYISCGLFSNDNKILAILQYHLQYKLRYCCSYNESNFVADNLCETEMHNSHWYNGCSESTPCHCYEEM